MINEHPYNIKLNLITWQFYNLCMAKTFENLNIAVNYDVII